MAHWPLWQSNGTKNTSFQESSPESSPVQNPGPVQGIVLPVPGRPLFLSRMHMRVKKGLGIRDEAMIVSLETTWGKPYETDSYAD